MMTTKADIARFFALALRVGLLDTTAVETWVDSMIAAESTVRFPFTELAMASQSPREKVDALLEQVTGAGTPDLPGHMVLALLRRRLRDDGLSTELAVKLAVQSIRAGKLSEPESYHAIILDEDSSLVRDGIYGDWPTIRRRLAEFLEPYGKFDPLIPKST